MTIDELRQAANESIAFSEQNPLAGEPLVNLKVPRMARGERIRISKGLSGVVIATQEKPPLTICLVKARDILRVVGE